MILLKIGGGEGINIQGIIEDLSSLREQCIIVHGANAARDDLLHKLGKQKKVVTSVSGYDSVLTDETMIDVMMMAYAGLKNKRIVELCQQHGINAVGLSGIDGKLVQGMRNKGIRVKDGEKIKVVRDCSGKPNTINTHLLRVVLQHKYTPVLSVPILDENNIAINTENDDVIRVLQSALPATTIIQFIEAPGLLLDSQNEESLVKNLTSQQLQHHEEHATGRMKRKLMALRKLFETSSPRVLIADGRTEHPLDDAMHGKGTLIQ